MKSKSLVMHRWTQQVNRWQGKLIRKVLKDQKRERTCHGSQRNDGSGFDWTCDPL